MPLPESRFSERLVRRRVIQQFFLVRALPLHDQILDDFFQAGYPRAGAINLRYCGSSIEFAPFYSAEKYGW